MDHVSVSALGVDHQNRLPVGTRLQEFVIERVIGSGGFGIVYEARDTQLRRTIAIKEYMPRSMAGRSDGETVSLRSEAYAEDFENGKNTFIEEARMLARFKHPALIEVHRFWEQNGTAYMAMPFYKGRTLKESLRARSSPPSETELKQILLPVLDALDHMHREQIFHRDVSPDNIMVLEDGRPVLLDLGAARRLEAHDVQIVTVLVKPGYAPIEQYAGDDSSLQGPWTDLYGWGASAYFALTGKPPPPSASRVMHDPIIKLAQAGPAGYSPSFLKAIDATLEVRPDDRPQSVDALKGLLALDTIEPATKRSPPTAARSSAGLPDPTPERVASPALALSESLSTAASVAPSTATAAVPSAAVRSAAPLSAATTQASTATAFGAPLPLASAASANASASVAPAPTLAATPSDKVRRPYGLMLGALVAIGAVAIGLVWMNRPVSSSGAASTVSQPSPLQQPQQIDTPAPATTPAGSPPAASASAAAPAASPTPAVTATPSPTTTSGSEASQTAAPATPAADKPALARLNIKPWGEVFVNGVNRGVTPPVKALSLPAGEYSIEVRNGEFPPHRLKLRLKAGEVIAIQHTFTGQPPAPRE